MSSPPFAGRRLEDHSERREGRQRFLSQDGHLRHLAAVADRDRRRRSWGDLCRLRRLG